MRLVIQTAFATLALVVSVLPLTAKADESSAGPQAPVDSSAPRISGNVTAVAPTADHGLSQVHGNLGAGSASAGHARDVELRTTSASAARPAATPRMLRKLETEKALASIESQLRACASESALTAQVTVGVRFSVAPNGDVESAEAAAAARVSPAVVACVLAAAKSMHFGAPGAAGASLVVPISTPAKKPSSDGSSPSRGGSAPAVVVQTAPAETKAVVAIQQK